jgi:hypothetical protein
MTVDNMAKSLQLNLERKMARVTLLSKQPRHLDIQGFGEDDKIGKQCFCIFLDTICEGRIPAWHDEKGFPVVYSTLEAAQREIADDVMEHLRQFLEGKREFEDAMEVEDYILPVIVLPNGSVRDADGNCFGKKEG